MEKFINLKWDIDSIVTDLNLGFVAKKRAILSRLSTVDNEVDLKSIAYETMADKVNGFLYRKHLASLIIMLNSDRVKRLKRNIDDLYQQTVVSTFGKSNIHRLINRNKPKVIYTLVPDHGNIGDLALGYAQREYMVRLLPNYDHIEIPVSQTYNVLRKVRSQVTPQDVIVLTGGGDMGTHYLGVERQRRFIIRKFKKNTIISFPQSAFFDDNRFGKRQLRASVLAYDSCSNLLITARDNSSYEFIKRHFHNEIASTPDIVLSLDNCQADVTRKRNRVVFSVRRDKEARFSPAQLRRLENHLVDKGKHVVYRDTSLGNVHIDISDRISVLRSIWKDYSMSELVITDRLHGMIFSVITNTPCVAINNKDGKVLNLYNSWLSKYSYIAVASSIDPKEIDLAIEKLKSSTKEVRSHTSMRAYFAPIAKFINERTAR